MRLIRMFVSAILICLIAQTALSEQSAVKVTGIYSDMRYNREGGDVLGMEIFVVLSNQGYYVVFQSAEGEPTVPVVVKANVDGRKISFALPPEMDPRGRFNGELSDDGLSGVFSGNGQVVRLKRKSSYWQ